MATTYQIGNIVRISGSFTSTSTGAAADPGSLKFLVKTPANQEFVYTWGIDAAVVRDEEGEFYFDLYLTAGGTWNYRWVAVGVATSADEGFVKVAASEFSNPLP